ncbi:MAG: NAD(P)/FAD-dependent oxidoreductase, partial [Oscillospiraceae bacterium]|nr:NAD(P)/FAD-dependent oxidoreductase [Oscillospiraceae bacterium]
MNTVVVIGGGASGIMAALTAAENSENRVVLLERQQRVGRKLLATGNGRCNLTNTGAAPENYHGEQAGFAAPALAKFTPLDTLDFFHALGLLTEEEDGGRVYPLSNSANSVLDVLRFALEKAGVELRCACP